jgi:hypothetical protein
MNRKFSGQLEAYVRQAGIPLRRIASQSGIPHQTIFNWLKGSQPRWHTALSEDLHHLGDTLGLNDDEITMLLRLAGCIPVRSELFDLQEVPMENSYRIPKGWYVTGDAPEKYDLGVDPGTTWEDHPCITIKSRPDPVDFAALAQGIKADAYHGKRLHFSAAMRSAGVENRAALFMRVGGVNGKMLAFDNMRNRPVTGTNDWTPHAIVLDVAEEAVDIIFGILLSLKGQVWMANVQLNVVDKDVPTTDLLAEIAPYFPVNLDFQE